MKNSHITVRSCYIYSYLYYSFIYNQKPTFIYNRHFIFHLHKIKNYSNDWCSLDSINAILWFFQLESNFCLICDNGKKKSYFVWRNIKSILLLVGCCFCVICCVFDWEPAYHWIVFQSLYLACFSWNSTSL